MKISSIWSEFWGEYSKRTSQRLKLVDVFLIFILLTGIVQFLYVAMVGTFPFNSFLSGFIATVGTFCLTVALRMQVNPNNKFNTSPERSFADYLFCNFILHLVVVNFMG